MTRAAIHRQIGKGSDQLLPRYLHDPLLAERADALKSKYYLALREYGYALPGAVELLATLAAERVQAWFATSAKPDELQRNLKVLKADDVAARGGCVA